MRNRNERVGDVEATRIRIIHRIIERITVPIQPCVENGAYKPRCERI